jgi:ATP-dependent Clp protease ATP-binding subunit ClpC
MSGELEKRVQAVVREASQPGIILFIDEIHTIMGSGGMLGTSDMGSLLKPSLARGDIAVIAATTNDEYRRFIENDAALERRFNPVRVHELSIDETMQVMQTLRDEFVKSRTITISDEILSWLLQFGDQYMRNRHFPDKAVDLLEQCVAHAVTQGKEAVDIDDAQEVAQRMVGMPLALEDRLSELEKQLTGQGLLGKAETAALINRLQVTMRGLDMRSDRPNAIIMLTRDAKENSEMLAQVIAQAVYGGEDRVIAIDFARFLHPEDVNLLVGAPPGYIGYTDSLPLHRLAQIPWCVLRFENVDSCHPYIREVLTQTFRDGNLMDGRGKLMHLSDTIVLITADIQIETQRSLGFFQQTAEIGTDDIEAAVRASIGEDLASQLDLVLFGAHGEEGISPEWLEQNLLNEVVQRYSKQGLQIQWDNTLIEWLMEALSQGFSDSDWERWVDNILTPALIQHLPHARAAQKETVTVKIQDGEIAVSKPQ